MSQFVRKRWPSRSSSRAKLGVVVDLAVLDDDARSVLVRDRLVAAGEVDDREPARGERDRPVDVLAAAVRARDGRATRSSREPIGVGRGRRAVRFHRSRTCGPKSMLTAAAAPRALERGCGRLSVHAAPDEARLPAGEARLVDELEVEERAHVRLAGGERDRVAELRRLLRRRDRRRRSRDRRSGAAARAGTADWKPSSRYQIVRTAAERRAAPRRAARSRPRRRSRPRARRSAARSPMRGYGLCPKRVDERPRSPACAVRSADRAQERLRRVRRRGRVEDGQTLAGAARRSSARAATRTARAFRSSTSASSPRSRRRRRARPARARARARVAAEARLLRDRVVGVSRAKPKTASTTRVCCAACSARASSSMRARSRSRVRRATAPRRVPRLRRARCCQRTTPTGSAVHLSVSSSTPTSSARPCGRSAARRDAEISPSERRETQALAAIAEARASRLPIPCEGRGERSDRQSIRGRARASRPSTSRSRGAPARGPVSPGRTVSRCQYAGSSRASSSKKTGRIGRGPTRLMSPRRTLRNCGISSSCVAFSHLPSGVNSSCVRRTSSSPRYGPRRCLRVARSASGT